MRRIDLIALSKKGIIQVAKVAQPGRALDPVTFVTEGEAEDRVVAGSNPALGTTTAIFQA